MIDTFERIFDSKTTAEWVEELNAKDIPAAPSASTKTSSGTNKPSPTTTSSNSNTTPVTATEPPAPS